MFANRASPLQDLPVIITRPTLQAERTASRVLHLGGVPYICPVVEIRFRDSGDIASSVGDLDRYDGIVATSANGLRGLKSAVEAQGLRVPPLLPVFTFGSKTAEEAHQMGLQPVAPRGVKSAKELAAYLGRTTEPGGRLLVLTGNLADSAVWQQEAGNGRVWDVCVVYDTVSVDEHRNEMRQVVSQAVEALGVGVVLLFYSPSAVDAVMRQVGTELRHAGEHVLVATIGHTTAAACERQGLRVDVIAPYPSDESLLHGVCGKLAQIRYEDGGPPPRVRGPEPVE